MSLTLICWETSGVHVMPEVNSSNVYPTKKYIYNHKDAIFSYEYFLRYSNYGTKI